MDFLFRIMLSIAPCLFIAVRRIARRVLAEQHLAIHDQYFHPENYDPADVGTISMHCDPVAVAKKSFAVAEKVCRNTYGCSPKLVFEGPPAQMFSYVGFTRPIQY